MNYKITDWNASPSKLQIIVATEPLSMSKIFIRAYYGFNNYGQDRRWSWWNVNIDGDLTSEVVGEESRQLLSSMVIEHQELRFLVEKYKIP